MIDDGRIPAPKQGEGIESMQATHLKITSDPQAFAVMTQLHQGILSSPWGKLNSTFASPPTDDLLNLEDMFQVRTSLDNYFPITIRRKGKDDKGKDDGPVEVVAERTFVIVRGGEPSKERSQNTIAAIKTKVQVTINNRGKIDSAQWTWQVLRAPSVRFLASSN